MGLYQLLKRVIKMNDLFYATEMLRYDKELEYRTLTGGILSMGIIIAVIIGFASMIIDTLSLDSINFTELISKESSRSYSELNLKKGSNFMLAVELWGVDLTAPVQYFSVIMAQVNSSVGLSSLTYKIIPLQTCTLQHWSDFPQIAASFDSLSMNNWLCPPRNTSLELSGDYTSHKQQYINISVNPCISMFSPFKPCANTSQIQQLFSSNGDVIRFRLFYTNPLINPAQKDYKSYYLQSQTYISFGSHIGGQAFLYGADYIVKTDNSIWPYPSQKIEKSILIEDKLIVHPFATGMSTYASFFLVKSPTIYSYQRQVQKISTVFSFIGGLISAVSASLFILKIYNNFAYEISVSFCIFQPPDTTQINITNIDMNFLTFLKIGKIPSWNQTAFIADCQKEIINQLDIKSILKRIIFLQYCMTNLFQDYQLDGLQIQKPKTPEQIRKLRQTCQSLDNYNQNQFNQSQYSFNQNYENQSNITSNASGMKELKNHQINSPDILYMDKIVQQNQRQLQVKKIPISLRKSNKVINLDCHSSLNHAHIKKNSLQIGEKKTRIQRNLSFLKQNAEQGNLLSKKIWNLLESTAKFDRLKHRIGYLFEKNK